MRPFEGVFSKASINSRTAQDFPNFCRLNLLEQLNEGQVKLPT